MDNDRGYVGRILARVRSLVRAAVRSDVALRENGELVQLLLESAPRSHLRNRFSG